MTSLTLVRRIRARPQIVFDAVTTADGISQGWGPDAGPVLAAEADPRVGGRFRVRFRTLEGTEPRELEHVNLNPFFVARVCECQQDRAAQIRHPALRKGHVNFLKGDRNFYWAGIKAVTKAEAERLKVIIDDRPELEAGLGQVQAAITNTVMGSWRLWVAGGFRSSTRKRATTSPASAWCPMVTCLHSMHTAISIPPRCLGIAGQVIDEF